ncbi:flagellin domain protein [Natronorubrum tibetense GA33]|uniref:Flagellin domain protein n=2 Tax=Natronorubrum tibetense TaxID=63128 RepID=L9VXX8_9EURY|nr:flagellin domain protein [Natronorubrum tibetense GA33]
MVIAATALLFLIGSPVLDAFESESERERAHLCMDETDHQLATVAATGEQQSMPSTDISECEINVADEGQIEFVWYNDSEADDIPWDEDNRTASAELGALEFELDDRTIAHQGGAVWEDTGSETRIVSEPGISYDNESDEENRSVQFNIMLLDQDELSSSDPVARADHERSDELAENITNAASESDGNNVAIRIESSYHDGWNRHLETTLDPETNENTNVSHDSTDGVVKTNIEGVRETQSSSSIVLDEDPGLENPESQMVGEYRLKENNPLQFGPVLENTGSDSVSQSLVLEVDGESLDTEEVDLEGGEIDTESFNVGVGNYNLSPGHSYSYQYTLGDGTRLLDTTPDGENISEFYLGKPGTHFNVTDDDIKTTPDGENITISADIWNQGVENATGTNAQNISLEFDHPDIEGVNEELELDYGAEGTVEWTINESAWPGGAYPFTIETENDSASGTLYIGGGQEGDGVVVTADHGVLDETGDNGDQRVDVTESSFTIETEVTNTNLTTETQDVALSLPGEAGSEPEPETVTLESNESETVEFDIDTDDFEAGSVYEYNVSTEDSAMTSPGTFYAGNSGTYFEVSETNATHDDENVTVTSNITNLGVESGSQDIGFELEYLDELPEELEGEDPYGYLGENTTERSFGESDTVELELNESNLIDGEYEAKLHTDDNTGSVKFDVDAGIDPGRVGLGAVEDAEVTVEVLGSQVSGDGGWWQPDVHNLAPMTLDVLADDDPVHSFENPDGGDNINTGPTWQDKSDDSYQYNFSVDDEIELTLRNTRHNTCQAQSTDPDTLPHYSGPTDRDFMWCSDAPHGEAFGPIDASQGENLQNVRVRSAENNTIPALPAGNDQQQSATEVLEQQGLIAESGDELDLDSGEFVFLFENTISTEEEGIDALWDDAIDTYEQYPDQTYDPNFNDLIVYVEVERAGVNPDTPSITIIPGGGDETNVSHGGSDGVGEVGDVDVDLGEGSSSAGNSPSVGTGESDGSTGDNQSTETGIDIDTDYIVIG